MFSLFVHVRGLNRGQRARVRVENAEVLALVEVDARLRNLVGCDLGVAVARLLLFFLGMTDCYLLAYLISSSLVRQVLGSVVLFRSVAQLTELDLLGSVLDHLVSKHVDNLVRLVRYLVYLQSSVQDGRMRFCTLVPRLTKISFGVNEVDEFSHELAQERTLNFLFLHHPHSPVDLQGLLQEVGGQLFELRHQLFHHVG